MFRTTARHFTSAVFAVPLTLVLCLQPVHAQVYEIDGSGAMVSTLRPVKIEPPATRSGNANSSLNVTARTMPPQWKIVVTTIAKRHDIDPTLFEAVIWQESRWNPSALSPKGAAGLAQLMPGTARQLGVDPLDPVANLDGGAQYLKKMLDSFNGDVSLALAAYNAGPTRVLKNKAIPPFAETQNYVASIQQRVAWGRALEE